MWPVEPARALAPRPSGHATHQEWQFWSEGTTVPGRYDLPRTRQGSGGGGVGHVATHCIWSSSKMGAAGGHLG